MTQSTQTSNIWILALIGGIIGATINAIIALLAPSLTGQSLLVPNPNTNLVEQLPLFAVIAASLIPAFVGAGVLLGLQKLSNQGIRVFQIIGVVIALLSLVGPITMPISTEIKIVLNLMHLVAASSIIVALSCYKKA